MLQFYERNQWDIFDSLLLKRDEEKRRIVDIIFEGTTSVKYLTIEPEPDS